MIPELSRSVTLWQWLHEGHAALIEVAAVRLAAVHSPENLERRAALPLIRIAWDGNTPWWQCAVCKEMFRMDATRTMERAAHTAERASARSGDSHSADSRRRRSRGRVVLAHNAERHVAKCLPAAWRDQARAQVRAQLGGVAGDRAQLELFPTGGGR